MKPTSSTAAISGIAFRSIKYGIMLSLFALVFGCKKEYRPPAPVQQASVSNTPPFVYTPSSTYCALNDTCIVEGYANDKENNISSYSWKKISGPVSYLIVTPDSVKTKITNLSLGEYVFEITVKDAYGLQGKAAIRVLAIQPGQNETVFKDLEWVCPMGCGVEVNKFHSFIPSSKPYQVFLRESGSTVWQVVTPVSQWPPTFKYVYSEVNNALSVYTDDAQGKVDLKIMY